MQLPHMNNHYLSAMVLLQEVHVKKVPAWELWAVIIPTLAVLTLLALKLTRAVVKRTKKEGA